MANNLMLNNCELVVCDASPRNLSDFLKSGANATGVGSPQEVASMPGNTHRPTRDNTYLSKRDIIVLLCILK
jgi:hypothetical protein